MFWHIWVIIYIYVCVFFAIIMVIVYSKICIFLIRCVFNNRFQVAFYDCDADFFRVGVLGESALCAEPAIVSKISGMYV